MLSQLQIFSFRLLASGFLLPTKDTILLGYSNAMKIGIVGARISGSYAGRLLSRLGHEVVLFDNTTEREKPCGGGVTFKALQKMHWLHEHPLPHTEIQSVRLIAHDGYQSVLPLPHAIHVFSRLSLESHLRQRAIESGARFVPERVLGFSRTDHGWSLETAAGAFKFDYLIGADGANSLVRRSLTGGYSSTDLCLALGYCLPGRHDPNTILIAFQESGFQGYIWSFPQVDRSSVGIGRWLPQARSSDLRKRLDDFIADFYPEAGQEKGFYAARIPCLSRKSLNSQRVCGERWALLGDAAGFADSITAEGIYYALRSAEILVECLKGDPSSYESGWRQDFKSELESAAAWRDRFYTGTVLSRTFIRRALQSVRHSELVRTLLDDLICGTISYNSLFRGLFLRSPQILSQAIRHKITNDE
jgi:flavin-dependent dehydrogenase